MLFPFKSKFPPSCGVVSSTTSPPPPPLTVPATKAEPL